MLPTVTHEELVKPFSFYFEDQIYQGMRHQGKLNFLLKTYSDLKRDKAYELAIQLAQDGISSVITVSLTVHPVCYRVWVDLSASQLVRDTMGPLRAV